MKGIQFRAKQPLYWLLIFWLHWLQPGLVCNYRWTALSLSLWLLSGGPQYFLSAHISLKSWTQKGLDWEAGWPVVQCAAPPDYGAFWLSLRQTVWLTESWPIFIAERLNIPFSAPPPPEWARGRGRESGIAEWLVIVLIYTELASDTWSWCL